jgi:acyl carrier protein
MDDGQRARILGEIQMTQNSGNGSISADALKSWLFDWLAEELRIDRRGIDPEQPFLSYGLDSVGAMAIVGDLEVKLKTRLAPTLTWDYPSINALANHLMDRFGGQAATTPVDAPVHANLDPARTEIEGLLAGIDQMDDQQVDRLLAQYLGESG